MMADTLKEIAYDELVSVILPYWMGRVVDLRHGGFFGRVDCYDRPCPDSDKAAILNARLVWAFSAAARVLGEPLCRAYADRAYGYFREHFVDPVYGGVWWDVNPDGKTDEQTALEGLSAMEGWMKELGLVMNISELGATENMLEGIANGTIIMTGGYKVLDHDEVVEILKESLN